MKPNKIVMGGVIIWALCVLGGFLHAWLHEPQPGFLSGIENVVFFLLWQAVALGVALVTVIIRLVIGDRISGAARWLGIVPIVLSGGFALFVTIWITTAP